MPTFEDGFIRAIGYTISGFIISLILKTIISDILENELLAILFSILIFGLSLYVISSNMEYWGILYTVGWFLGLLLMFYSMSSLIAWYEIVIYLFLTIFILIGKISNKLP